MQKNVILFFKSLKRNFFSTVFENYFLIYTIGTILIILTGKGYVISVLIPMTIYYLAWNRGKTDAKLGLIDYLWLLFFVLSVGTWLANDYPYKTQLIGRFFMAQGAYMMAYWIGRNAKKNYLRIVITKSYFPVLVTSLIGLYTYLFRPAWYMRMMLTKFEDVGHQSFQEFARLRSIFPTQYVLAYFCTFVLIFYWFYFLKKQNVEKKEYAFILVLCATILFCMMRGPIVCALLALMVAVFHNCLYSRSRSVVRRMLPFCLVLLVGGGFVMGKMNVDDYTYIVEKVTSVTHHGSELVQKRANLYVIKASLLGEGAGRHSFYADEYPPNYQLPDNEYQKTTAEVGYVGVACLSIMFILGLLKGVIHFKYLYCEMCIIAMCLICMVGASCLTIVNEHPFVFWLALGQISGFNAKREGLYELEF